MNLPKLNKSGFILLNKSASQTSHRSLASIKRRTSLKVGHTGTLDPMATGAMVVVLGDATKFSRWIIQQKKCYTATIQLGSSTDTDDRTGQIIESAPIEIFTIDQITQALKNFEGTITQTPPKYSAIHINGKRAYDLARKQQTFEMPSREVTIEQAQLINYKPSLGTLTVDITCESGTYIRSIARDLGVALKCPAHLAELHRHWVAPFISETYLDADEITDEHVISLEQAFVNFKNISISKQNVIDLYHGKVIELAITNETAAYYQDKFIGMLSPIDENHCKSIKLTQQHNLI